MNDDGSTIINGAVIPVLGNPGYAASKGRGTRDSASDVVQIVGAQHPPQCRRVRRADLSGRLRIHGSHQCEV
jgi:hypothetical protein